MSHFYERNSAGEIIPRHFVGMTSRSGELRPTRITDARKKAWYPSVTTIQGLLDKPALTDWKITEHLKQAFHFDIAAYGMEGDKPNLEGYLYQIKQLTQTALDKAPKDGTDFHDSMEKWFTGEKFPTEHQYACQQANDIIIKNTGAAYTAWTPEKSFVHTMGFAGKVDLHCHEWTIDFKTKNSADKWKPGKMHYPEMAMQLAAYRVGLGLDNARCANVFICLENGAVEFHEWDSAELDKQFANFTDLLRIWLRNAGYIPGKPQ